MDNVKHNDTKWKKKLKVSAQSNKKSLKNAIDSKNDIFKSYDNSVDFLVSSVNKNSKKRKLDKLNPVVKGVAGLPNLITNTSENISINKKIKSAKNKKIKKININPKPASELGVEEDGTSIDSGVQDCISDPCELINWEKVKLSALSELSYISDLMKFVPSAEKIAVDDYILPQKGVKRMNGQQEPETHSQDEQPEQKKMKFEEGDNYAKNYQELRKRFQVKLMSVKKKRKKNPADVKTKREERMLKKSMKKVEKKKNIHNKKGLKKQKMEKNAQIKMESKVLSDGKATKPIYNKEGNLVFSKFDFTTASSVQPKQNKKQDLQQLLSKALKDKEKVRKLQQEGNIKSVNEFTENKAWKNALLRAEGEKVLDDTDLLKKSIKKREIRKKNSKRKMDERQAGVAKKMSDKQKKRMDNLKTRKDDKMKSKVRKLKKKGRILPGF